MDIVKQMRSFEIDHEPDGWPAVQMKQISALCDEIERLTTISENWLYYQELLKSNGFSGITDLLAKFRQQERKNFHLQSLIDATNAQDALGFVFPDDFEKLGNSECAADIYSVEQGHPSRGVTLPVYARPIPAQQSIEQAHMAGQADAGIDPSYSNAQAYAISVGAQQSPAEVPADCLSPTVRSSRRYGQPTEHHLQSPAVTVPDGWKLVPTELTQAMLFAANSVHIKCGNDVDGDPVFTQVNTVEAEQLFNAFLLAAPTPPKSPRTTETIPSESSKCSQRITEQELREIAVSAWRYWMNNCDRTVDNWIEDEGRALIDKLSGEKS